MSKEMVRRVNQNQSYERALSAFYASANAQKALLVINTIGRYTLYGRVGANPPTTIHLFCIQVVTIYSIPLVIALFLIDSKAVSNASAYSFMLYNHLHFR